MEQEIKKENVEIKKEKRRNQTNGNSNGGKMKKKTALDPGSNYQDKNISNLQSTETPRRKKKIRRNKREREQKNTHKRNIHTS